MLSGCTGLQADGRVQDGLRSISQEIFDISSPNLVQFITQRQQGQAKTKFKPCYLGLIFRHEGHLEWFSHKI